jgi:hypothetical protein
MKSEYTKTQERITNIRRLVDELCQDNDGAQVADLIRLLLSVGSPNNPAAEGNLTIAITHCLTYSDLVQSSLAMLLTDDSSVTRAIGDRVH